MVHARKTYCARPVEAALLLNMKRAFTLVEILIVVALVAMLAAFLWPVFERMRSGRNKASCQSNLKQIGLGLMQYIRDYDEKWPPARATSLTGWSDVVMPYIKSEQIFQCPAWGRTDAQFSTDYFYNRRLSRVSLAVNKVPSATIMTGDGEGSAPTWNSWLKLPADAKTNSSSPAQRHTDGANYGFADGHVKFFKPQLLAAQTKSNPFAP